MPYYDYSDWLGDFVWYLFVPNLIGRFCLRLGVSLSFWEKFQVPAISVSLSVQKMAETVCGDTHIAAQLPLLFSLPPFITAVLPLDSNPCT